MQQSPPHQVSNWTFIIPTVIMTNLLCVKVLQTLLSSLILIWINNQAPSFPSRLLPFSLSKLGHLRPPLPFPPFIRRNLSALLVPESRCSTWHRSSLLTSAPSYELPISSFLPSCSFFPRSFGSFCKSAPARFYRFHYNVAACCWKSCQTVSPSLPTAVCSPRLCRHSRRLCAHVARLLLLHRTGKHVWKDNWNVCAFSVLSLDAHDEESNLEVVF